MLGVEDEKNENGAINFPIELQAATTEGSSIHMGIIIFFLLMTNYGTMAKGNANIPMTFSIIVSATLSFNPPVANSLTSIIFPSIFELT